MFSLALLKDWLWLLPYHNMLRHVWTVFIISWHVWNMPQTCFDMSWSCLEISRRCICLYLLKVCLILNFKCREIHFWVMSGHHQKAQEISWTLSGIFLNRSVPWCEMCESTEHVWNFFICVNSSWHIQNLFGHIWTIPGKWLVVLFEYVWNTLSVSEDFETLSCGYI